MGNPTVYRGMEMGWKNSSELTEIVKDQTTIRYRYDKEGMRNRKYLSDGTTVLYQVQDGQIIGEQHLRKDQEKPLYEMTFSYDADGTLFSMNCDGKDYYYILNPTGDVIALVDTGWNTVVSYAYDSWGKVTAIEGDQDLGKKNPLRYRGYYWDEETGLYYLASRYYDPEVGRFINADNINLVLIDLTVTSDKNLYTYCDNNPIIRKDINGECWIIAIAIGVGTQYAGDVLSNLLERKTGADIFKPSSSIGDYVAAGVTALIPGSGIGGALVRNAVTEGILSIERRIKKESNSALLSITKIAVGTVVDAGMEKLTDRVTKHIRSKGPKNYSSYMGQARKKNPKITREQAEKKITRAVRWVNRLPNCFEFIRNVAKGGILRKRK